MATLGFAKRPFGCILRQNGIKQILLIWKILFFGALDFVTDAPRFIWESALGSIKMRNMVSNNEGDNTEVTSSTHHRKVSYSTLNPSSGRDTTPDNTVKWDCIRNNPTPHLTWTVCQLLYMKDQRKEHTNDYSKNSGTLRARTVRIEIWVTRLTIWKPLSLLSLWIMSRAWLPSPIPWASVMNNTSVSPVGDSRRIGSGQTRRPERWIEHYDDYANDLMQSSACVALSRTHSE